MEKYYVEVYCRGSRHKLSLHDLKRVHKIHKTSSVLPRVPSFGHKDHTAGETDGEDDRRANPQ
jgi:hypothetical protein